MKFLSPAQFGEHERALGLLEEAVFLGWCDRAWRENDSDLATLRELARFRALLASWS